MNTDQIAAEAWEFIGGKIDEYEIPMTTEDCLTCVNRIKAAIEKDREYRRDVLQWEQGYKCAKAELADDMRELAQLRAAQAGEPDLMTEQENEVNR